MFHLVENYFFFIYCIITDENICKNRFCLDKRVFALFCQVQISVINRLLAHLLVSPPFLRVTYY